MIDSPITYTSFLSKCGVFIYNYLNYYNVRRMKRKMWTHQNPVQTSVILYMTLYLPQKNKLRRSVIQTWVKQLFTQKKNRTRNQNVSHMVPVFLGTIWECSGNILCRLESSREFIFILYIYIYPYPKINLYITFSNGF